MTDEHATGLNDGDYDAIEAAVMETPRGRWFLREFARRNRAADTHVLLEAIDRLERGISDALPPPEDEGARRALAEIGDAVRAAKAKIAGLGSEIGARGTPGAPLSAALTGHTARLDILKAAERVGEMAIALRSAGWKSEICEELDRATTAIYTACAFQDLMARRTLVAIEALRDIDEVLAAPDLSRSAPPATAPETRHAAATPGPITGDPPSPAIREMVVEPATSPTRSPSPVSLDQLLALDRLDLREKLKQFT